jgi:signal transduction histidine kinase
VLRQDRSGEKKREGAVFHQFVADNREELIRRCRVKVLARSVPPATPAELEYGVPRFLDQLVEALQSELSSSVEIDRSAARHGRDLQLQGFTVSQVVHDYGDVCQSITDLALELSAPISVDDFRTLNRCLDDAIASAVTEYGRESSQSIDAASARDEERFGFLVHEIRNLINTATIAFEVLKTGNVGVGGSTGSVLQRSLSSLRDLITHSVDDVRTRHGSQDRVHVGVAQFIEELASSAALEATARGLQFTVQSGEAGVTVQADREVLAAVVMNLLQNAFKFTRPRTTVGLRVTSSAERVLIEIQDECGGLPTENVEELFRPFQQRNLDRTGLGLGLAFSRWGTEVNRGRIHARNLPDHGCVFTVDLPRVPAPALAMVTP